MPSLPGPGPWRTPGSAQQLAAEWLRWSVLAGLLLGRAMGWPSILHGHLGRAPGTAGVTLGSVDPGTGTLAQLEPMLAYGRPCAEGKWKH